MSTLLESLENFKERVKENDNVHKLVQNWDRNIVVEAMDTESIYTLLIRNSTIETIIEDENEDESVIRLEADEDVLSTIFTGKLNPAEAVLNGELVVFGDPADQIKLDAITLLIWGM
jgi:hypothetical protein